MIALRLMHPDEVHKRWEWIRTGLLQTIRKTKARMMPEEVWHRIRSGSAFAHAIDRDQLPIGFIILCSEQDQDGLVLFVWALWSEIGELADDYVEVYSELERVAREIHAVRIRMQSPRPGWEKQEFFKRIAVVYEHEVMPC